MRKIFLTILCLVSIIITKAQIDISGNSLSSFSHNFIPSNFDPKDLKPSDIPSIEILRNMGFSEKELNEIEKYKSGLGEYNKNNYLNDTLIDMNDISYISYRSKLLNENLGDSINDTIIFPKEKIYGQAIFRNNNLSFFQKSFDAKAPENYRVGTGDEISISVWGYNEFSENLIVDERGYISPSSYGRIYVKGLTFKKMRSLLKSRFSNFFDMKNSEIDVTLSYSRVITVNIVGEVYYPGSYSLPAINTAFNALFAANGPTQIGSVRNIYIKRDGELVDSLDVYEFMFNSHKTQDIFLEDGDYIFVPPANKIVEVIGEVNRPYTYEAKNGESVKEIIKFSGGFTTDAYTDIITLKRKEYNNFKVIDVKNDHLSNEKLANGDKIIINKISGKTSNVVKLEASIGVSGEYEFVKGDRLLDLLKKAKCISNKTFLDKVYVIRKNSNNTRSHLSVNLDSILKNKNHKDNILLQEYDIVKVLSTDDFLNEYSVNVFGNVRNPKLLKFGKGMTLHDAILQSGGLMDNTTGGKIDVTRILNYDELHGKLVPFRSTVKSFTISPDFMNSTDIYYELLPDDQIYVRKNSDYNDVKRVKLYGEVMYPGTYSLLRDNETVHELINRAGGLKETADKNSADLKRFDKNKVIEYIQRMNIPKSVFDSIAATDPRILNLIYTEKILELASRKIMDTTYYKDIAFNLSKALSNKKSKHNLVLKNGDLITINQKLDYVNIEGELNAIDDISISAPFLGKRAHYYVKNYGGGYSMDNKKSNTVVISSNGAAKKTKNFGLFTISPKVTPGSTIKVLNDNSKKKKQKDIDYDRHIQSVITKITAVISLTLLIERLNGSF